MNLGELEPGELFKFSDFGERFINNVWEVTKKYSERNFLLTSSEGIELNVDVLDNGRIVLSNHERSIVKVVYNPNYDCDEIAVKPLSFY
jgi:hypothetical protein